MNEVTDPMLNTFSPSIFGTFIKEQRHKRNLSIEQFSYMTKYSTATISLFENESRSFDIRKFNLFLKGLQLNSDYLSPLENHLDNYFHQFAIGIIYEKEEQIDYYYHLLRELLSPYKGTTFFIIIHLVNLIYCLYNDSSIAEVPIDQLKDASYLFADNVAFLYYMYMAEYAYYINNEFADSLSYFAQSRQIMLKLKTHPYFQMYHYLLSQHYASINDYENCLKHCQLAAQDFTEYQNFPRLVNTNIQTARAYMIIKDYSRAQSIHISTLSTAKQLNLVYEEKTIIYNMTYIEMICEHFQHAFDLFLQIPPSQMNDKHYRRFAYTCIRLNKYDEAKDALFQASNLIQDNYSTKETRILNYFLQTLNFHQSLKKLIQLYTQSQNILTLDEKEYLLHMIIWFSKQAKQYKKTIHYMELLFRLRIK